MLIYQYIFNCIYLIQQSDSILQNLAVNVNNN
nr:MAG TPA_asm: hypothetical protein [Caudoviricetes sp.]